MYKSILTIGCLFVLFAATAQRGGFDQSEMVLREKETVITKVTDLSDDQKLLLTGIYDEFAVTLNETVEEIRKSGDYSAFRTKMPALRTEKDLLIKDVLSETQYIEYDKLVNSTGMGFNRGQRTEGESSSEGERPLREDRPARENRPARDTTQIAQ